MSSAEQLTSLISSTTALSIAYSEEFDRIDAALSLALERVGDTLREFHVDQVNGNDANDGTAANPLQSLLEANLRSVWNGITRITLVGDYEMRERFTVRSANFFLLGDGGVFDFAADSTNNPGELPGFVCNRAFNAAISITMDTLTLNLPADPTEEGIIINTGLSRVAFKSVDITLGTLGATRIISSGTGALGIALSSSTYPAEMPGRWVEAVVAGTSAQDAIRVAYSSLATL